MDKLRAKVKEIAKIAQECPDHLQQSCFEILLKHELGIADESQPRTPSDHAEVTVEEKDPKSVVEESAKTQEDIADTDLHVKARRFLDKQNLTVEDLNQIFYKEGDKILSLYDDLKTTRTSESQVRITLLQCLHNALTSGNFQTSVEAVREEATTRKCYDGNNFGNNYTNNATLFDFDKYSKNVKVITLSEEGKRELADVIREIG